MASRISQMRSAQLPQQTLSQQQLNESIAQVQNMMRQVQHAPNKEAMLMQMLQNNPNTSMIFNLLQGGNGLEGIAKQMASYNHIDINNLINQLMEGLR